MQKLDSKWVNLSDVNSTEAVFSYCNNEKFILVKAKAVSNVLVLEEVLKSYETRISNEVGILYKSVGTLTGSIWSQETYLLDNNQYAVHVYRAVKDRIEILEVTASSKDALDVFYDSFDSFLDVIDFNVLYKPMVYLRSGDDTIAFTGLANLEVKAGPEDNTFYFTGPGRYFVITLAESEATEIAFTPCQDYQLVELGSSSVYNEKTTRFGVQKEDEVVGTLEFRVIDLGVNHLEILGYWMSNTSKCVTDDLLIQILQGGDMVE